MRPNHIAVALVALDVILDVLTKRNPHFHASALVWAHIEAGHIVGYLAAHSFITIHYLLRRHLGSAPATRALGDVREVFQVPAAEAVGTDCVITRNTADFREASLPVLHPIDLPGATQLG